MNENDNQPMNAPEYTPGIALSQPTPPAEAPAEAPAETPAPAENPAEAPQPAANSSETPAPANPSNPPAETPAPQMSYEEYLDSLLKDLPEAPATPNPSDEKYKTGKDEDLVQFFTDFEQSIIQKSQAEQQRAAALQQAESKYWGDASGKYPEIASDSDLRNTIQNIRMGSMQTTGKLPTPLEVADALIGTLHNQYKKGVNDTNVQTQVVASQPNAGGSRPQTSEQINYEAVQSGNQGDLVGEVTKLINMGKI